MRALVRWLARTSAALAVRVHPHLMLRSALFGQPPTYAEDGLATVHNCDFIHSSRFQHAYALGKATGSWHEHDLNWRLHTLFWCGQWAAKLPGAFVECGVHRGGFARAIIDYTQFATLNRRYWLFDTFNGFDAAQLTADEEAIGKIYHYEECYEAVQATFAKMPFVSVVRGTVPASLLDTGPVAFLSIDMNCTAPEIAAAEFFWPKLVPGGVMVLDDYGWALHHAQKIAFDHFAQQKGVEILSLPTGQGLVFKPGSRASA